MFSRFYCVDFFVFFVLRHRVSLNQQVLIPRMRSTSQAAQTLYEGSSLEFEFYSSIIRIRSNLPRCF